MDKQQWLDWAEITDAWRVVPRIILFGYCWWTVKIVWYVLHWYTALPTEGRSLEASGLAAGVITAVTGLTTWAIKFYVASGRKWSNGDHSDELTK